MFGLGGGELFIVVLLAILLIGPREMPKAAHQIGKWVAQLKLAIQDIKSTVEKEIKLEEESSTHQKKS